MKKPISEKEALLRLQYLCSKSEKCSQDIMDKLRQWNYQGDFEAIVSNLEHEKFVDNIRFTVAYARDKFRFSAWGKNKTSLRRAQESRLLHANQSELDAGADSLR